MGRERPIDPKLVARAVDAVVRAMQAIPEVANAHTPSKVDLDERFSGDMTIEQWVRWSFVPRVERIIANDGPWPASSSGGARVAGMLYDHPHLAPLYALLNAVDGLLESNGNPAEYAYRLALAAFEARDFDAAVRCAEDAIALDATHTNAPLLAGWALLRKPGRTTDDLARAIPFLERARSLAPDATDPLVHLADALLASGRGAEAVATMTRAIDTHATYAHAHNWLGWYFTRESPDLPRAIDHLERALGARTWGVAWMNYARALDAAKRLQDAAVAYACSVIAPDGYDAPAAVQRKADIEATLRARGETPFDTERWLHHMADFAFVRACRELVDGRANEQTFSTLGAFANPGYGARALDALADALKGDGRTELANHVLEKACIGYDKALGGGGREPDEPEAVEEAAAARHKLVEWRR